MRLSESSGASDLGVAASPARAKKARVRFWLVVGVSPLIVLVDPGGDRKVIPVACSRSKAGKQAENWHDGEEICGKTGPKPARPAKQRRISQFPRTPTRSPGFFSNGAMETKRLSIN